MVELGGPPVKLIVFTVVLMVFQLLIVDEEVAAQALDFGFEPSQDEVDFVDLIFDTAFLVVKIPLLFFQLATFTFIDGMPWWLRLPFSLPMLTTLVWSTVAIVARVVEAAGAVIPFT